jgi:hypothetical protein
MNIISPLITNLQTTVAVEPCSGSLYDPAIATQPLAAVEASSCDSWLNASLPQRAPQGLRVVCFISMKFLRPFPRAPSAAALDRLDGVKGFKHHPGIMHVGRTDSHRERNAFGFDHKMALRARFASIRRILPGFEPPFGAATLNESIEARDQSSWSASASLSSNTWCSLCQTPASCHSRSLRQQVTPEPQPISGGSQDHGRLALKTKMMPRKQSRFEMRGRPPRGFSGSGGNNGSTTAHSSSLTIGFAIGANFINSQFMS